MIVDASALCAVVLGETDADIFERAILGAAGPAIAAINMFETRLAARRQGVEAELISWLDGLAIRVVSCDAALTERALAAHARYGKGNHRAKLNLGDCYAYALSKASGRPLLFKGRDFALTDAVPALTA